MNSVRTANQLRTNKQLDTSSRSVAKKQRSTNLAASPKTNEKGWISLTSTKTDTHNFHLRNRQRAAMANFKVGVVYIVILNVISLLCRRRSHRRLYWKEKISFPRKIRSFKQIPWVKDCWTLIKTRPLMKITLKPPLPVSNDVFLTFLII
jgi:hypothetical protein